MLRVCEIHFLYQSEILADRLGIGLFDSEIEIKYLQNLSIVTLMMSK